VTSAAAQLTDVAHRLTTIRARRDELVCQRRSEGASLRAIAAEGGISHSAVRRILERRLGVPIDEPFS